MANKSNKSLTNDFEGWEHEMNARGKAATRSDAMR